MLWLRWAYLARHRGRTPDPGQRWLTFVHSHAQASVFADPAPLRLIVGYTF
jgi:hypothetical protein